MYVPDTRILVQMFFFTTIISTLEPKSKTAHGRGPSGLYNSVMVLILKQCITYFWSNKHHTGTIVSAWSLF